MPGLLSGVLPAIYSAGDRAKRYANALMSDPMGMLAQTAGGIQDEARQQEGLMNQAFANPQRPLQVTDPQALAQASNRMLTGLMGFAPAGIIDQQTLSSQFPQVDFSLQQTGNKATLSKIVVPKELRNSGIGSDFMNALTKAADEDKTTLMLSPSSDFGGNKNKLIEFYKRYGFIPNKGRNIDYEISESMYRAPK